MPEKSKRKTKSNKEKSPTERAKDAVFKALFQLEVGKVITVEQLKRLALKASGNTSIQISSIIGAAAQRYHNQGIGIIVPKKVNGKRRWIRTR